MPGGPILPAAAERTLAKQCSVSKEELTVQPLPLGWAACRASTGEIYYHNSTTTASQWAHPGKVHVNTPPSERMLDDFLHGPQAAEPQAEHSVYDARSRHVPLPTPSSLFSDSQACVQREDLQVRVFALHGLLSREEGNSYVAAAGATGFKGSDVAKEFPAELRNNERLIHFSDDLAETLWRRMGPLLKHRDIYLLQPMGYGAEGRWKPVGINPCFRISRYHPGQHFAAHRDGMYVNNTGECSIYSLVLYLNDDFEGGELELPENMSVAPKAGTAVLFPHDVLHAGREVKRGTKYIARSEIMFRCVEAAPPPSAPNYITDPLWQKMATLYEQVGDLAVQGDASKMTEAYQEALGIQIAHQGTSVHETTQTKIPIPEESLARSMLFLEASDLVASLSASRAWSYVAKMGVVWRALFQRRWPRSCEVIDDMFRQMDPELKDWFGDFRRLHVMELGEYSVCTMFMTEQLDFRLAGGDPQTPVRAAGMRRATGVGWDASFKQRGGWRVGLPSSGKFWFRGKDGIDWEILPQLFAFVFQKLHLRPFAHRIVLPGLPGVQTAPICNRIAQILKGRFEVPAVSIVPAPLCALLAHGHTSGVVVWGCSLGVSVVCCYLNAKEIAVSEAFDVYASGPNDIAVRLCDLHARLGDDVASTVFQHVVFTVQGVQAKAQEWASIDGLHLALSSAEGWPLAFTEFHASIEDDVMLGADVLAATPELLQAYDVQPAAAAHWEWRVWVDGEWQRLPPYVAGVLEGALQNEAEHASVWMAGAFCMDRLCLVADLIDFRIAVGTSAIKPMYGRHPRGLEHFEITRPWRRLTRFVRGRPSSEPDRRTEDHMQDEVQLAVDEVTDVDALHVRTLTGECLLSMPRCDASSMTLEELVECLQSHTGKQGRTIGVIANGMPVTSDAEWQPLLGEEGDLNLVAVVGAKVKDETAVGVEEAVPEGLPGEYADIEVWRRRMQKRR